MNELINNQVNEQMNKINTQWTIELTNVRWLE